MAYKSKFTGKQIDDYLDSINNKQDKLVSSTNIKTINGESILGSGDITISGGSSSGGSGVYPERIYTDADGDLSGGESGGFIFEIDGLQPNVFHVFPECQNLSISLGPETSGVANEYLFQFNSGSEATTLTMSDDIKWTEELIIEPNKIYQVSILKGLASVLSWENAPKIVLIQFSVDGASYNAEEGMTWETWVSSSYTNGFARISGNIVYWRSLYAISGVLPKDTIIANRTYTTYMAD